jgi:putative spermidine/putrescine transport system substrate-binding protein
MGLSRRLGVVVAALALALGGCSSGPSQPTATAGAGPTSVASGAAPSAAAVNCSGTGGSSDVTLTWASYGGVLQDAETKAWLDTYTAANGVKFTIDQYSNAKVKTQVESGQVTWDIVNPGNDFAVDSQGQWFEPLDYSVIPRDQVKEGFSGTYRIANIIGATVLGYNTTKTNGQTPQSWADFFDLQKFPGKRAVSSFEGDGILEIALVADGVDPQQLYPLDVDRALHKLDSIKSQIVYWDSGATSQELLGSGEVALAQIWNGRAANTKLVDKKPVEIQWNQAEVWGGYIAVPKGAAHKDEAMKVIACVISQPYQEALTKYIAYAPSNKNAVPDPAYEAYLPTATHLGAQFVTLNDQYWADNFDAIDAKWQDWKTK